MRKGRITGSASRGMQRRDFLRLSAALAATPALSRLQAVDAYVGRTAVAHGAATGAEALVQEATIAQLQAAMEAGHLSSLSLVEAYLKRIRFLDHDGPHIKSVLQVNPDARDIAAQLDQERADGHVRGPLHGIPILLKDNIDTHDRQMTTAGSLALAGDAAPRDATVARRLRRAGAVILGKANLSEWANFRGFGSSSGWSGAGLQTLNPYVIDRNPCGSSSGSAAAVSANFVTVALGTETDGSIVCPANNCGVVGIKPTVGLTSRAGVVPIAHSQDTVGPHGRTVADAAAVLGALVGVDPRDQATQHSQGHFHTDYTQFLDPDGLDGARIGVCRSGGLTGYSSKTDEAFEAALDAMAAAGAVLVDPADIPTIDEINTGAAEITVLVYEFKRDLNAYLATRTGVPAHSMQDVIDFNRAHAGRELHWFGQEWFEISQSDPFTHQQYVNARHRARRIGGPDGIDAVLQAHDLDALVAPTGAPAWTTDLVNGDHFLGASSGPAAIAGYPIVNVPMGDAYGLPVGISFIGTAWSEPMLITLASGFEAATNARRRPEFRKTLGTGTGHSGFAASHRVPDGRRPSVVAGRL